MVENPLLKGQDTAGGYCRAFARADHTRYEVPFHQAGTIAVEARSAHVDRISGHPPAFRARRVNAVRMVAQCESPW